MRDSQRLGYIPIIWSGVVLHLKEAGLLKTYIHPLQSDIFLAPTGRSGNRTHGISNTHAQRFDDLLRKVILEGTLQRCKRPCTQTPDFLAA